MAIGVDSDTPTQYKRTFTTSSYFNRDALVVRDISLWTANNLVRAGSVDVDGAIKATSCHVSDIISSRGVSFASHSYRSHNHASHTESRTRRPTNLDLLKTINPDFTMGNEVTKTAEGPPPTKGEGGSLEDLPDKIIIMNTPDEANETPSLTETQSHTEETASLISSISDTEFHPSFRLEQWDRKLFFSDFIRNGLEATTHKDAADIIMLYESPSSSSHETSFFNSQVYKFHDYPPSPVTYKAVLAPCRYTLMNGSTYPSYLRDEPPAGMIEHWQKTVPGFVTPSFVQEIPSSSTVYAYLPCEHIAKHVNDPHVHYHLAGKDAIHLMSSKTTKLLANTQDQRPCICKTTHSMGSKGIFVIRNDEDEALFNQFLQDSGNPTFIVTEFVDIGRNVACHFFIHPTTTGQVTWFGSNENCQTADGDWSTDSTIVLEDQDHLRDLQLPFVQDVVHYCQSLGFWGFCGIDVLFDTTGVGYLVDVNPRVTGSCPAIMLARLLEAKYGFKYALFRRNPRFAFRGSADQLLHQTDAYNEDHEGESMIVLNSFSEVDPTYTLVNIIVYSASSLEECEHVADRFVPLIED